MDILEKVPDLAEKGAPQPKAKRPRYWQINKCIHRTAGRLRSHLITNALQLSNVTCGYCSLVNC